MSFFIYSTVILLFTTSGFLILAVTLDIKQNLWQNQKWSQCSTRWSSDNIKYIYKYSTAILLIVYGGSDHNSIFSMHYSISMHATSYLFNKYEFSQNIICQPILSYCGLTHSVFCVAIFNIKHNNSITRVSLSQL